ncbi:hypothetical protein JW851_03205 [Candidatus Woesearchaeota archaeon]|nr:hypothetical protein [Candidatus Woesearchaeota archaeon]
MKKSSFKQGMGKLMNKGYSKQGAFNKMKQLASRNKSKYYIEISLPYWVKYVGAIVVQLFLIFCKIPSKEGMRIRLIETILPLSASTQQVAPFIRIIVLLLQIYPILILIDLIRKAVKSRKC